MQAGKRCACVYRPLRWRHRGAAATTRTGIDVVCIIVVLWSDCGSASCSSSADCAGQWCGVRGGGGRGCGCRGRGRVRPAVAQAACVGGGVRVGRRRLHCSSRAVGNNCFPHRNLIQLCQNAVACGLMDAVQCRSGSRKSSVSRGCVIDKRKRGWCFRFYCSERQVLYHRHYTGKRRCICIWGETKRLTVGAYKVNLIAYSPVVSAAAFIKVHAAPLFKPKFLGRPKVLQKGTCIVYMAWWQ